MPPTEPQPPHVQDNAELPEYDVAVVVFTRVRAVDRGDASGMAERAVSRAVRAAQRTSYGPRYSPFGELRFVDDHRGFDVPVVVAEIRDLGVATGDSYLSVAPTAKAYRAHDELREREGRPPNDAANTRFPECPECGARPGQAHDPTCSIREDA